MERIKDLLKNFKKKWSVFPWEKNGMNNMRSHIDSLNIIFAEKIQEMNICEGEIRKIRRTIRIRLIRSIFGFFSAEKKTEEDKCLKETCFDRLLSVVVAIRIVCFRFSVRF